jgi:RNA polymerase sigma-70 factor (ECF subfamily)
MGYETSDLAGVADNVKDAWHRYLDLFEPLRPELYRYSRALTRSAWDAEDLTQDVLPRGLVALGGSVSGDLPLTSRHRPPRGLIFFD